MINIDQLPSNTISPPSGATIINVLKPDDEKTKIDKHIFIIHGWNSNASDMDRIKNELLKIPGVRQRYVWMINYETHRTGFDTAAQFLKHELNKLPHNFSDTIYFTYSLGGLIARQLIADGMQCTALLTLCTPHDGILKNIPILPWDKGEVAMKKNSAELNALETHSRDIEHRKNYYFFGFGFLNDKKDRVYHDKIVSLRSALGNNLKGIIHTLPIYIEKDYGDLDLHHKKGMDPNYCQDGFNTLATILKHVD